MGTAEDGASVINVVNIAVANGGISFPMEKNADPVLAVAPPALPHEPVARPPVHCKHWMRGLCHYGDSCRFQHPARAATNNESDCSQEDLSEVTREINNLRQLHRRLKTTAVGQGHPESILYEWLDKISPRISIGPFNAEVACRPSHFRKAGRLIKTILCTCAGGYGRVLEEAVVSSQLPEQLKEELMRNIDIFKPSDEELPDPKKVANLIIVLRLLTAVLEEVMLRPSPPAHPQPQLALDQFRGPPRPHIPTQQMRAAPQRVIIPFFGYNSGGGSTPPTPPTQQVAATGQYYYVHPAQAYHSPPTAYYSPEYTAMYANTGQVYTVNNHAVRHQSSMPTAAIPRASRQ